MNDFKEGDWVQYLDNGCNYKVVHTRYSDVYDRYGNNQILVLEDNIGHMVSCTSSAVRRLTHHNESGNILSTDDVIEVEWEIIDG